MTLDLYLEYADGSSYCALSLEDTPENRRALDREARLLISRPNVLSAEMRVSAGRSAGYERSGPGRRVR